MTSSLPTQTNKELRNFGLIIGGVFCLLYFAGPWVFGHNPSNWLWWAGTAFLLPSFLFPPLLRPVYKVWMRIGHVMGLVNSKLILTAVFVLLFTPLGLLLRLFGRDLLRIKRMATSDSNWDEVPTRTPNHYERPY